MPDDTVTPTPAAAPAAHGETHPATDVVAEAVARARADIEARRARGELPEFTPHEMRRHFDAVVEAYEGALGRKPLVDKWTFSTNGVATAGMHGIPTLGLGPGNEVYAHAPNEACPVQHLSAATDFYAALVARLNGRV